MMGYLIIVVYCLQCGSGRSVAPIKAGFVARVGRRTAGGTWFYRFCPFFF